MTATTTYNGKEIEVSLTTEQIEEVKRKSEFNWRDLDTIEKCFEYLGEDYPKFFEERKHLSPDEIAYAELKMVVKAINGGVWVKKGFWPYFKPNGSKNGFSYLDIVNDSNFLDVPSCMLLADSIRAIFVGNTFEKIYEKWIN